MMKPKSWAKWFRRRVKQKRQNENNLKLMVRRFEFEEELRRMCEDTA